MLKELKSANNIYEVADILGFQAKNLAYILYSQSLPTRYTDFCISKKNGKSRNISAPIPQLKLLQRRLSDVLYECRRELLEKNGGSRSFGFEKNVGIFENAANHRKKRWVFNTDIADFFPSINFGRVRGYFLNNHDFALDPVVATIIAQISCYNNSLPQGAPSSPIIANLLCGSLDYRLSRLAKRNHCSYSRYADDITFSTNEKVFSAQIAIPHDDQQGWAASAILIDIMSQAGFRINPAKSRMSEFRSRQMVTGLVTNRIINTPVEERKFCRASVHRLLNGIPIEPKKFCDDFANNCDDNASRSPNALRALEARIVHCYKVRDRTDNREKTKKFYNPNAISQVLRDFYLYKYFARPGRPIILTEGLSDVGYIRAALKASNKSVQHLCVSGKGPDADIICDFYKFPELPGVLTGLNGGTGNIRIFLDFYAEFIKKLAPTVQSRPVILLLDSDKGLKDVLKIIRSKFGTAIDEKSNDDFTVFNRNMALVKTPISPASPTTDIEDFLDQNYTKNQINGKTFTRDESYDRSKYFGKIDLAKYIFQNRSTANFSQFKQILDRISKAADAI